MDEFSTIISDAKRNGKLIFKNSEIKSITKNNLQIPLINIYQIDLSNNKFTAIPEILMECLSLQVLLCSHNLIRNLPPNIFQVSYLETLDLSCNHLTSLPPSLCKLQCLKILIISSNRLVSLPNNIGRLSSLEEFDSSCNSLTCLPDDLSGMNKLRYLNLRHNKLLDVPSSLHKLPLEILDLSENQLTFIPNEYHIIDTLHSLNLSGNPLNVPPANVCNKGLQHIMKYLQSASKRQSNRNVINLSSQNSLDYSGANGTYRSDALSFEVNEGDSLTMTSTNSQHSIPELDLDQENSVQEETRPYEYESTMQDLSCNNFLRTDSGYHTLTERVKDKNHSFYKSLGEPASSVPTSKYNSPHLKQENGASPILNTVKEISQENGDCIDGHYQKNRNSNLNYVRNIPGASPSIYRSSRLFAKKDPLIVNKCRRNSVPIKGPETTNNNDQDTDHSSQCVVVVDNGSSRSRKSSPRESHQSNNNAQINCAKNISPSHPKALKSKVVENHFERQSSLKIENLPLKRCPAQTTDTNKKIQEKINKFHKIIEAQLHVHINSKKLSEELSNGVYLCHLANILIPHSIPTVHTPSPGQQDLGKQKSKRNLDNFLETCRRNGTAESCLFTARDVLSCNPVGLLQMAQTVDALIESIRIKKSRPCSARASSISSHNSADHINWHSILANPSLLSSRPSAHGSMRTSSKIYNTVGRASKSTHKILSSSAQPKEDIIKLCSEV